MCKQLKKQIFKIQKVSSDMTICSIYNDPTNWTTRQIKEQLRHRSHDNIQMFIDSQFCWHWVAPLTIQMIQQISQIFLHNSVEIYFFNDNDYIFKVKHIGNKIHFFQKYKWNNVQIKINLILYIYIFFRSFA